MKTEYKKYYDLIYLCRCALNNETPNLEGINIKEVAEEARKCSVLPLIGSVIPQLQMEYLKNVKRTLAFDAIRERMFKFFDENGIWYCPLKGIVIKDFYPKVGQRFMADNDILFDTSKKDIVRKWILENGGKKLFFKEDGISEKEDSFMINDFYHFELHHSLFKVFQNNEKYYFYFSNKELLNRMRKENFKYAMTDIDFYLYFLIHSFNHTPYSFDFRELIDCFIINSTLKLDYKKNKNLLKNFGLLSYEKRIRQLAFSIFSENKNIDEETIYEIFNNNTFGNSCINDLRKLSKGGPITKKIRRKAIFEFLFIPARKYKYEHPVIYKSIILRPLYVIFRFLYHLFFKFNETKENIRIYKRY